MQRGLFVPPGIVKDLPEIWARIALLGVKLGLVGMIYLLLSWLTGVEEVRLLASRLFRRKDPTRDHES